MAESPTHALGQIIGKLIEDALHVPLKAIAEEFGYYLDRQGQRTVRGNFQKVVWQDLRGNGHELDYVFESGGTDEQIGTPRAFIELAWRRYKKHSKNKAQEIEGAVGHLGSTYHESNPFLGAVLAGEFTKPSIRQLESHGFAVLYFSYQDVASAFLSQGVDIRTEEGTSDDEALRKLMAVRALSDTQRDKICEALLSICKSDITAFTSALRAALTRELDRIFVLPLHGVEYELTTFKSAMNFIQNFDEKKAEVTLRRYEIGIRFKNGSKVEGSFVTKWEALDFLNRNSF
jgi:hypothetical protein